MKKLICITCSLILVFSSFALAFADSDVYTARYNTSTVIDYYTDDHLEDDNYIFDLGFHAGLDYYSYEESGTYYAADYITTELRVTGGVGSHFTLHVSPDVMDYYYEDGVFSQELFEESFEYDDFFQECGRMTYDPDTGLIEVYIDEYDEDYNVLIQTGKLYYAPGVADPYLGDYIPLNIWFVIDDPDQEPVEMNLDSIIAEYDPYMRDFAKLCSSYTFELEEGITPRVTCFDITKPSTLEKPEAFSDFIVTLGYDPLDLPEPQQQSNAGLSGIIDSIGSVFSTTIGFVSTTVETITSTPLLLLFAIVPLIYLGVNMTKRLLNL
ncbi:MAG: hypothetical protein Q4E60_11365 [Bacteroidales bacterium]|nr:hypothetical protein [Bacteroidales bacterium]